LLREGHVVAFRGVGLSLREPGLVVVGVPSWFRVENMPQAAAAEALLNGEAAAAELIRDNAAFGALASGRTIEVQLLDDGSGLLATRRDGVTTFKERWSSQHPQTSTRG
jgi:hypothetical protein